MGSTALYSKRRQRDGDERRKRSGNGPFRYRAASCGIHSATNDARRDIPSTLICTAFTADQYQTYAKQEPVASFLAGIPELRKPTWVDLPTSHWPMWSRPTELAQIIGEVARARVGAAR